MSETEARAADDATPVEPPETETRTVTAVPAHAAEPGAEPVAGADVESAAAEEPDAGAGDGADGEPAQDPSWWHRSHPTFAGLMGFFAGVAYVILVPGVYATLLSALVAEKTAQKLFPLVLVALIVPIGMLVPRKTRRFAQFMLLGLVATALVIGLTATVVLWVLVQMDK